MSDHIPDHVFRGYDLRGLAGSELTFDGVKLLAQGYATWLIQRRIKDCVVGYDCRLSSIEYRDALVAGLTESGIDVYDIGLTLTQISYFSNYFFRTKGAIMITASHNPKEYNGFKFGTGYSETMVTEDIVAFRELVKSEKFLKTGMIGRYIKKDISEDYFNDITRFVGKINKFKVVIDACAATAGLFLPEILRRAGCEVVEQNTKPDGNFPVGTPDPTAREVQERLAQGVVNAGADIGFSYDCDGDRLGVVDEKGNLIWNDVLLSLYAQDSLDFQPGAKIVYNNLCSKQVDEVIRTAGGVPIVWKTGHSFIKAKVKESGAVFGGELSGHFYFVDNFYGHDDSAIASLRILSYLTRTNQTLSQAISKLPKYISSPEIKVGYPDNIKFAFVKDKLAVELKKMYPDAKFNEIDGVRMDSENEMIVMRASQNGPYLTIKFEAREEGVYNKIKTQINDLLHNYQEIDFAKGVNLAALK